MAIPLCSKAAVDNIRLDVHTLNDLAVALRKGLRKHFANVHVEITECPNLTEKPFGLSRKGLGRKACVVQCGDPGYVIPDTMTEKVYSFTDVAKVAGLSNGLIIGCGAGPWQALNYLSEMIADIDVSEDGVKSFTKNVYTEDNEKKTFKLVKTGPDEDRFSALGNLYCSDGSSAQVLKVQCGKRIGYQSLSAAIRDSLNEEFKDPIGGVFLE